MILYRPVGLQELELIYDSGMKSFPARLPQQPIFYPVLDLEYARQTASSWNAKNGQLAGYVTQFKVEDKYADQFETHTVGKSQHQELWIPAEEMDDFNRHIVGHIKVVEAHFGNAFEGFVPEQFGLKGKNAVEQFTLLANSYLYKRMEFYLEIKRNHKAVFLNYPFWQTYEFKNPGLKEKVLWAIKEAWLTSFPKIPLPLPSASPEETPLVEKASAPTYRLVDPVQEEITLEDKTDSESWMNSVAEETMAVEEADSDSVADLVEDVITPVKNTTPPVLVTPVREEMTPVEKTDLDSLDDLIEEDIPPEEEIELDSLADPADEQIPPREKITHSLLLHPVHKESTLPRQTSSHVVQGIKLGLSGKVHEAIDELSQAVEEDPDHVTAHISLGVAFHRLGEDDRALSCYETAIKIDPRYAEAYYFRANILYDHGNVREAITGYTLAIGLKPELIEAHQNPIPEDRLTDYTGSPAEMHRVARTAYRILALNKSIETDPRQADLFKERAAEYDRLGNYEQAIADYSTSLALQPQDANALHARGVAYERMGQHHRAQEDYKQAIVIDPRLADEYLQRGVMFGNLGNLRQSIANLTEGIRLAPKNPDGYFNRGTAYFQQGDFRRSRDDFSSVIRLSPGDEAAYYWRGICNEETGHRNEAIADYRQFLAISQDPRAREEIEQKLRRWNVGNQDNASGRSVAPGDIQKLTEGRSEKPDHDLDLYDLITALGQRALDSTWLGSGVDCYGESAQELLSHTNQGQSIEGHELFRIASGIRQTIKGDFQAFDSNATSHWIFIRAWNGTGFYIEINDRKIKQRLKFHFKPMEEVEGASPPYEGFFIGIQ